MADKVEILVRTVYDDGRTAESKFTVPAASFKMELEYPMCGSPEDGTWKPTGWLRLWIRADISPTDSCAAPQ